MPSKLAKLHPQSPKRIRSRDKARFSKHGFQVYKKSKEITVQTVGFKGKASTSMGIVAGNAESKLAQKLVDVVADGDSSDVDVLCKSYGLKRSDLGRLTGFSLRALAEWASGKLPSEPAKRRLHEVRRLLDALAEIVETKYIPNWLNERNKVLDGMTPLQTIELGEIDRLWEMVYQLGSGNLD